MKRYLKNTSGIICSLGLLISATANAQQPPQRSPWLFTFEGGGAHQSESDLKDTTGAVAVDRWFLSAGINYGFGPRNSVGVTVGGGKNKYEFSDLTGLAGGEPWGTIKDTRISFPIRFGFGETGMAFIIPTIRTNGESGASSSDSRTYGLFGAFAWRVSEDLTIGPGFGVFSRLESSTTFFPILAIDWTFADRWTLSTGSGLASSRGPGLNLSYELNDNWSLGVAGRYEDQEFRLDDQGVAAGGVGRDQSFPFVFTADMKPNEKMNFSVFAGVAFGGSLRLKDSDNILVEESDYDVAPVFGASFQFRF